jgi:hypothetical protein
MVLKDRKRECWLKIFERLYYCFRIPPYGPPKVRAVKKEQKLYLWDWSLVPEPGEKFENFFVLFPGENRCPEIVSGTPREQRL